MKVGTVKKVRLRRFPFFEVEGSLYLDILYHQGDALEVDLCEVAGWLRSLPPSRYVIGLRCTGRVRRSLMQAQRDAAEEIFAHAVPRLTSQWVSTDLKKVR